LRNNACATALRNVQGVAIANSGGLLGSASQLVQAMAGFGGSGAAEDLNTAALGADTSQQAFLTAPQHA
jgi:hypothetical protein